MKYRVEVTSYAQQNADSAYFWLTERTENAVKWLNRLEKAIEGLAVLPMRCPLAVESREFGEPIHQLLVGKSPHIYRVLFIVRQNAVFVLHIRHGAREYLRPDEIVFPPSDPH